MKENAIVFILGAGASVPYGFPTGEALVQELLQVKHRDVDDFCTDNDLLAFQKALKLSGYNSVDSFLENVEKNYLDKTYVNYVEIGKKLLVDVLLRREISSKDRLSAIFPENWYRYLWNLYKYNDSILLNGHIKYITFNYDLSLEQFYYDTIHYSKYGDAMENKKREEMNRFIANLPITHLYGQLGYLDWQDGNHCKREYATTKNQERITGDIKLIRSNEDLQSSAAFQNAYRWLQQAELVVFLGYSFDQINNRRLKLDSILQNVDVRVLVSGYGFYEGEHHRIRENFPSGLRGRISFGKKEGSIVDFLKEHDNHFHWAINR